MKLTYEASWPDHHVAHPEALRDRAPVSNSVHSSNSNPFKAGNMRSAQPIEQLDHHIETTTTKQQTKTNGQHNQTTNIDKLSTQPDNKQSTQPDSKQNFRCIYQKNMIDK